MFGDISSPAPRGRGVSSQARHEGSNRKRPPGSRLIGFARWNRFFNHFQDVGHVHPKRGGAAAKRPLVFRFIAHLGMHGIDRSDSGEEVLR